MRLFHLVIGAFALAFVVLIMRWDFSKASEGFQLGDWATSQIKREFAYFESKRFSHEDIEKEYKRLSKNNPNSLLHFQIIDGKIISDGNSISDRHLKKAHDDFYKFFASLIKDYGFDKDVSFIVSKSGEFKEGESLSIPVIVPFKHKDEALVQVTILAPDHHILSEWGRLYNDVLSANERYGWNNKIEKSFWRGSSPKAHIGGEALNAPRLKLVQLSKNNPSLIDAKFTKISQTQNNDLDEISSKFPIAMAVSQSDHVKHKMQIYVEGGESSVSADLWRFLSNTVTLKQNNGKIRWFDAILQEDKHYLYMQNDLSDALDKINWVLENDKDAKKIAEISTKLITQEITPDHLCLYWKRLLTEMSKLQDI